LALNQKVAPVSLDVFVGVAFLLTGRGERQKALELLFLTEHHSASTAETKETARRYRTEQSTDLSPQEVAAAKARGETLDWEAMAEQLGTELSDPDWVKLLTQAIAPLIGTAGERFQLKKLIATGGMGEVYLGQDVESGQPVAIKRLRPDLVAQNPETIQRFIREGEVLRQLDHPNVVKVLATYEDKDQPVIVIEYVGGGSLQDLLDRQPRIPLERVLAIGLELADALARVHHLGILHRDLKPGNILLAEDGTPRLTDFGVASLLQPDTRLTQEGTILGTSAYLSPEAWRGQSLDASSDIWSFGAVLYEMLAGRPPFAATNAVAIMTATLNDPLPDLTEFRPDAPPALVELIEQMLVKERSQRLNSMRQVGAGLETINRTIARI
jgi:predicted Ser/Thr protein kinase